MWRQSHICKHKHLNSKYIRWQLAFPTLPEERKAQAPACSHLLTPAAGFAIFLPSDTKPEMQFAQQPAPRWIYFNFLAGFVEMFFSGFANQCPTIYRDDFHPKITVNNRGSAELVHACSKLSENHCKFASEIGVCKKWMNLYQTSRSSYFN